MNDEFPTGPLERLVGRLRDLQEVLQPYSPTVISDAIAEIERLQAELEAVYSAPVLGYLWSEGDCRGGRECGIQRADPGTPSAFGSRTPLIAQPKPPNAALSGAGPKD